jgi:hypothetical protein
MGLDAAGGGRKRARAVASPAAGERRVRPVDVHRIVRLRDACKAGRIERAGGRILYPYASIGGFAVTARRPQDGAALRRRLTHIPGIQSVHPDTAIRLAPPGAPQ